jgi:nucleotide-binding universal stress UspA family protein
MSDPVDDAAQIRAVLHPTDFTTSSELAFAHALKIALAGKTRLDLLHVEARERDELDWTAFPAVRQTLAGWGLLAGDSPPEAVAERLGVRLRKIQVHERDAVRAILRFLEKHPSDLIVLATHGREGLPRWLHGSIAEPLARKSETATLFIPHGLPGFVVPGSGALQLRRILIPVDHAPRPEALVRRVGQLSQLLGADGVAVRLLYVGAADEMPAVRLPAPLAGQVERIVRSGDVVEAILAAAREPAADLIAMATAGHQGFLDALRGSTTERVLRQAPCPVLAVPAV